MHSIQIGPLTIGPGHPPVIVAEAGINWANPTSDRPAGVGYMHKAFRLISAAAEAGAHIVKFQTHIVDAEMLRDGPSAGYVGESFYDLISACQLSFFEHKTLQDHARQHGIIFMSTPFSREAADMLDEIGVPAFKTGSGELTNIPLLRHIARKDKPMIVSTGMSTPTDIMATMNIIRPINPDICLMNCASTYPSAYKEIRLLGIPYLQQRFDCPVGQSDHSIGIATALAAVALGACVVEKHFTLGREWPGPDQQASILPDELKRLVVESRQIWEALGHREGILTNEIPVAAMAHHSVVTIAPVPAGAPFSLDTLWVKRPGTGIPAAMLDNIMGKVATRDLSANTLLTWADIQA